MANDSMRFLDTPNEEEVFWRNARLFAVLPILIGLGGLCAITLEVAQGIRTRAWPSTDGVIVSSKVQRYGSGISVKYGPQISYVYKVDGVSWEGPRVSYGEYQSTGPHAQASVDRYPPGKAVKVFYCPRNPDLAVLETGIHSLVWFAPLAAFWLAAGLWVFFHKVQPGT